MILRDIEHAAQWTIEEGPTTGPKLKRWSDPERIARAKGQEAAAPRQPTTVSRGNAEHSTATKPSQVTLPSPKATGAGDATFPQQ
jgi:hypothetical protein